MKTMATGHIWVDERGRAWVGDTNTKVIEVVLDKIAYGSTPEEIHDQHPHLTLAQIHAALSYYYDHQQELDAEIARQEREFDELRAKVQDSPLRQQLRAMGKLPLEDPEAFLNRVEYLPL